METKEKKKNVLMLIATLVIAGLIVVAAVVFFMGEELAERRILSEEEEMVFLDVRNEKEYRTVKIGEQEWFAENLKIGTEGLDSLILIEEKAKWEEAGNEDIPAYSVYGNKEENGDTYGYLYNWHAINLPELCPEGWSVPTDEDWHLLERQLKKEESSCNMQRKGSLACSPAGAKMKIKDIEGTDDWNSENFNCDGGEDYECSGFNALPGGSRYTSGTFFAFGFQSYFWSSTQEEESAFYRNLREKDAGVLRNKSPKGLGMSVRCIKK